MKITNTIENTKNADDLSEDIDIDLEKEINIDIDTRRNSATRRLKTVRLNLNPNSVVDRDSIRVLELEEVFRLKSLAGYSMGAIHRMLHTLHE